MKEITQVWKTSDNETFDSLQDAKVHQLQLRLKDSVKEFVRSKSDLSDNHDGNHTEFQIVRFISNHAESLHLFLHHSLSRD